MLMVDPDLLCFNFGRSRLAPKMERFASSEIRVPQFKEPETPKPDECGFKMSLRRWRRTVRSGIRSYAHVE